MTDKKHNILLVEDEESLAVGLEFNLTDEGYNVMWAKDGREALEMIANNSFDLIILDIMLPYYDGFEVAERTRANDPQMPILMLTARTGLTDRLHGLDIGADDYMTKPFHLEELLLRIKGMLKRKSWYKKETEKTPIYNLGKISINFELLEYTKEDETHTLTHREAMVLKYFIANENKIITRQELLEKVWNIFGEVDTRTVDNFIARLRKYFEPNPKMPIFFKSIRSVGYQFTNSDG